MNAVIYPRVSSLKQVDGTSLDTQERACRDWCDQNGVYVEMVFLERGESAKTADRKQLQAALAYVKARKDIDCFVVHKIDRFARRSQDFFNLRAELAEAGCKLVSVTEPLDDSPAGRFMEGMLSLQAQFDNEVRAERSKAGMTEVIKRGGWAWVAPLGYKVARLNGLPTLVQDKKKAPLVKMLFERCLQTDTLINYTELCNYAYEIGLRTRSGKKIAKSTLMGMLTNPVYISRGRTKLSNGLYDGQWEKLIPLRLWNQVQERLRNCNKNYRKIDKTGFILDGFVKCAKCGRVMLGYYATGRKGRKYPYFKCNKCNGQNVSLTKLIQEFEYFLDRMRVDKDFMRDYSDFIRRELAGMGYEATRVRNARTTALQKLQKDQNKMFDLLMRGTLTEDIYNEKMKELKAEIDILKLQGDENEEEIQDIDATIRYLTRIALEPRKIWSNASDTMKLDLQRLWIPSGIHFNKQAEARTTLTLKEPTTSEEIIGSCSVWLPRLDSNQRHMD